MNSGSYSLDYDVLGVDVEGNTVTFGFLHIDSIEFGGQETYETI